MDSLTDPQGLPQGPIPPPDGLSTAPPGSPDDLDAAALKKQRSAEIRALSQTFGDIPDVPIFTHWDKRMDCSNAAIHRSIMAGICGNKWVGVYSVALSNLYKDNEDGGDVIIYTGAGGRERWTNSFPPKRIRLGPRTMDQSWDTAPNNALITSFNTGNPVRVIRSWRCGSQYAPPKGYRYDGLYKVAAYWTAKGQNGKKICRCRLERLPDQPPIPVRPITISVSRRRRRERLISHPTPGPPLPTDIPDTPSPATLAGCARGVSEGSSNPPQQRAMSEASTRIDFNVGEVDHDTDVPQPFPPQRQGSSSPAARPRYRWDPKKNQLIRVLVPDPVQEDLDVLNGQDEENRVEDDVTLVPSEVGHAVNERMETEYFSDTGGSPRYGTPDEPPASESSVSVDP